MCRAFFVEANRGLRQSIREWLSAVNPRPILIGEAADDEIALPMIRDLRPDVLLVDLELPFNDGLELCREVRRNFPWIEIVAMSGNDDLEYAREVRRTGAGQYLLKPVGEYELGEALQRAMDAVVHTQRTLSDRIRTAVADVTEYRREQELALERWVRGGGEVEFEVKSDAPLCRMISVRPEREQDAWICSGILRLMEIEPTMVGRLFAFDLQAGSVLVAVGEDSMDLEQRSYGAAYTVRCAMERYASGGVRILISEDAGSLEELRQSCMDMQNLAKQQSPGRPIYGRGDAERLSTRPPEIIDAMADFLLCADESQAAELVQYMWNGGFSNGEKLAMAARMLVEEATGIRPPKEDWTPLEDEEGQCAQICRAIRMRDALAPGLKNWLTTRARYFLAVHSQRPGMPLHRLAAELGVTVNRMGVVFTQEMGVTISEYLSHMRVSAAKELLETTRMRVSGVAARVGDDDVRHFDSIFRACTGMDMRSWRKLHAKKK